MTDPIRDALDWLNQRLLPTLFGEGVNAAFLQSWASHARAALAAQPPVGDDDDRAALQGLLDRVHMAATDPAAWLGLKQGDGQSPALDAQPPAPAASTTLDMDSLLRPEGAYQRGTGHEDGAQLVSSPHGPEWWAPLYGCDTLDNLLDRLRARILPYLRPPVAGIDVPGPDGDYGDVMDLCAAEGVDYRVGVPLLKRARQAWKVAASPPAPYVRPLAIEAGDAQQDYRSWLTYFELGGNCGGGAKLSQENCRSLAALLRSLSPTLLRQLVPPPEGLAVMEYVHIDSGARIISEPSEKCSGGCWIVRNSRHVNPCTEFRTVADAVAALHPAQGGDVQ